VAVPSGLVAGVATKGLSNHMSRRPVVKYAVEKPIVVADYVAKYGKKDAGQHIVADLQQVLADAKQRLRASTHG
jgi:hypothetical protein